MKIDVMGSTVRLTQQELEALTKETKETLAMEFKTIVPRRVFGAVDMWNAKKRQRTAASMRKW